MKKVSEEKGIISLVVLFCLLFLLILVMTLFVKAQNQSIINKKIQSDISEMYKKNKNSGNDELEFALENEVIQISNCNEFNLIGTGSYIKKNEKLYKCSVGRSYVLSDNIIFDIKENIIGTKEENMSYKIYSKLYDIDTMDNDIYYYYDGNYYQCIAYQNFLEQDTKVFELSQINEAVSNSFYNVSGYRLPERITQKFLMLIADEEGNYSIVKDNEQHNMGKQLQNINSINVYRDNISKIVSNKGKYYLFVCIGNTIIKK